MLKRQTYVDTDLLVSEVVAEFIDDCRIRNLNPTTVRWHRDRRTARKYRRSRSRPRARTLVIALARR